MDYSCGLDEAARSFHLPGCEDGGECEEASVGDLVLARETPVDDPVEQAGHVGIELEQQDEGLLRQGVHLKRGKRT